MLKTFLGFTYTHVKNIKCYMSFKLSEYFKFQIIDYINLDYLNIKKFGKLTSLVVSHFLFDQPFNILSHVLNRIDKIKNYINMTKL